jgi:glycosyltransferase involved in cell wall biosynthesis
VPLIWDAISELIAEDEGFRKNFVLSFVGNVDGTVPGYFREKALSENLELISYVPHQEVTRLMAASDLLFFVVPRSRNNKLIITGKLFEYLASGRPVISVGPTGGDASAILEDTARDSMLEYDDKDGFKRLLLGYYRKWEKDHGSLPKQDTAVLDKYSRHSSAGKLADIMHEMTKGRDEN